MHPKCNRSTTGVYRSFPAASKNFQKRQIIPKTLESRPPSRCISNAHQNVLPDAAAQHREAHAPPNSGGSRGHKNTLRGCRFTENTNRTASQNNATSIPHTLHIHHSSGDFTKIFNIFENRLKIRIKFDSRKSCVIHLTYISWPEPIAPRVDSGTTASNADRQAKWGVPRCRLTDEGWRWRKAQ